MNKIIVFLTLLGIGSLQAAARPKTKTPTIRVLSSIYEEEPAQTFGGHSDELSDYLLYLKKRAAILKERAVAEPHSELLHIKEGAAAQPYEEVMKKPLKLRRPVAIEEFPELSTVPALKTELDKLQEDPEDVKLANLNAMFFIVEELSKEPEAKRFVPLVKELSRLKDLFILSKNETNYFNKRISNLEAKLAKSE